jgi:hypothetical protein
MGMGVTQQSPHLRRTADEDRRLCVGITLVDLDLGLVQLDIEVARMGIGVFPGIRGHLEDSMFAVALFWGKKWGKVPHRFQPIST